jgi:hypothetical protein
MRFEKYQSKVEFFLVTPLEIIEYVEIDRG